MAAFGLFASLAFAAQAAGEAPEAPRQPTVMIVELPRGAPMIGLPARCPGEPPEEEQEEDANYICLAELYQGRLSVVRHISGPRVAMGTRLRLTAHARRWRHGTRMLVATVPFDDKGVIGQFAFWWDTPEERGDFCEAAEDVAQFDEGPVRRAFEAGSRRRFRASGYNEAVELLCIRGGR